MTGIPRLPPPPDADRLAFRGSLIDESSASEDLNPVLRWLTPRLPSVAGILKFYPDIYRRLRDERGRNGTSPELEAEALALAADISTVMQSLRRRPDVTQALEEVEGATPLPMVAVDQLLSSLLLIAGGDDYVVVMPELLLDDQELEDWFSHPDVIRFIDGIENASA